MRSPRVAREGSCLGGGVGEPSLDEDSSSSDDEPPSTDISSSSSEVDAIGAPALLSLPLLPGEDADLRGQRAPPWPDLHSALSLEAQRGESEREKRNTESLAVRERKQREKMNSMSAIRRKKKSGFTVFESSDSNPFLLSLSFQQTCAASRALFSAPARALCFFLSLSSAKKEPELTPRCQRAAEATTMPPLLSASTSPLSLRRRRPHHLLSAPSAPMAATFRPPR